MDSRLSEIMTGKRQRSLGQAVQDIYGLSPDVSRLNILPRYSKEEGFVAPQFLYDMAKASVLPGHAISGGVYEPADVTNLSLSLIGSGTFAGLPEGALGANSMRPSGPVISREMYEKIASANSKKRSKWSKLGEKMQTYDAINDVRSYRYKNAPIKNDPLEVAAMTRPHRLRRLKEEIALNNQGEGLWRKNELEYVKKTGGNTFAVNDANLKAVTRELKKEGWTLDHTSRHGGSISSRYFVSPDGNFKIRLSDHILPDTPMRRDHLYQPSWHDEYVLRGDEKPTQIIQKIKSAWSFGDGA